MSLPILYSYRRCPYAMRARMALRYVGVAVEIREISLKQKPAYMLQVSPKGTVPVLVLNDGSVIDQSLDIMHWALSFADKDGWLNADLAVMSALIAENDGAFKQSLDRYKYAERFPEHPAEAYRVQGEVFLAKLETLLTQHFYLMGDFLSMADIAIFPFIRQFAAVDPEWFEHSSYRNLRNWLNGLISSDLFIKVMEKTPLFVEIDS